MQLKVSDLKQNDQCVTVEKDADTFPVLAQLHQQGDCVFLGPVSVELKATVVASMVELTGHIHVSVSVPCSRCLMPCPQEINADFHQTYVEHLPEVSDDSGEELELSAEDMGLELIVDDTIDLVEEIQQQVVLLIPDKVVCSTECKGLCIDCGADLNKATCRCAEKVVSLNFAALKDFKVEK